jgi:hypothetical protein
MGKKVAFATSNWKNKPSKPANVSQADWDAENSSCFSGFPFPVFVGKKYQDGFDYFLSTDGAELSKISSPQTITRVTEYNVTMYDAFSSSFRPYYPPGSDEAVDNFQLISGPSNVTIVIMAKIAGWMEPGETLTVNYIGIPESYNYDYPEYDFTNLPPGINASRREMIHSQFGFIGPFSRQDITRLWWTAQAATLGTEYTYSTEMRRSFSNTPISTAAYDEIDNKLKGPFELVVFDVDSEDDFYIQQGDLYSGRLLTPVPNQASGGGSSNNEAGTVAQTRIKTTISDLDDQYQPFEEEVGSATTFERSLLFHRNTYSYYGLRSFFYNPYEENCSKDNSFELQTGGEILRKRDTEVFTIGHVNPFSTHTLVTSYNNSHANPDQNTYYGTSHVCALDKFEVTVSYEELSVPFEIYEGKTVNVKVNRRKETLKRLLYTDYDRSFQNASSSFYDAGCNGSSTPYPTAIPINFTSGPSLKMIKFLEYDDGNGNPIYDKTTGEMLRDPVTGEEI